MTIFEIFVTAFTAIKSNKLRSFLTMLGVIIGVFSVLSLVSLVQGIRNFVTDQFNSLGSNLILVVPGRANFNTDPSISFSNNKLTLEDASDIERYASNIVVGATPNIRLAKTVKYKTKNYFANVVGVNSNFPNITNFEIETGRTFTKQEDDTRIKVAIIGAQVKKELFGNIDPLGKTIKIGSVNLLVIGTFKPKGGEADQRVVLPINTLQTTMDVKKLSGITIKAKPGVDIDSAMDEISLVLLRNHKKDDFSVLSQKDILNSIQNVLRILSLGLGGIASISLLVGGIGIMNIMLVSVNERIKEIGLRKAVGATPTSIALQFLIESITISVFGGLIGILLGWLMTFALRSFVRAEVPLWAIALSFSFSLLVGVVFGTYPAVKASRKDPIEALRYE